MALNNEHTLLLVDDETAIIRSLKRLFRKEGYKIFSAENGLEGLECLKNGAQNVSLIISDQRMPGMTGAQFLEEAKKLAPAAIRYLLTGYSDIDAVIHAINKGEIHRYITKPWNDDDLLLLVRQGLEHFELIDENKRLTALTIKQNKALTDINQKLEQKVNERTKEINAKNKALLKINKMLESSIMDSTRLAVSMVETFNHNLGALLKETARLSRLTGEAMGMSPTEQDTVEMAGLLHDIGLLGIPEDVWAKDMRMMNDDQLKTYCEHPVIASIILENVEKLADVSDLVLSHHEQVDGNGFPNGLFGKQIPIGSKIVAVVSEYFRIVITWPHDKKQLISLARRTFEPEIWKSFTLDDDPEVIIAEAAEKRILSEASRRFDVSVISTFIKVLHADQNRPEVCTIAYSDLSTGMTLMEDLRVNDGRLLLSKGTKLKATMVDSIKSIGDRGMIPPRFAVSMPPEPKDSCDE
jgi:response regulator RpfG family c-di-GMP phosphodiesterase